MSYLITKEGSNFSIVEGSFTVLDKECWEYVGGEEYRIIFAATIEEARHELKMAMLKDITECETAIERIDAGGWE